jgi:collagen type VII alpha
MSPPPIKIRGIRTPIPAGYLLGRTSSGKGPAQLIKISDLAKTINSGGGGGAGQGGGGGGGVAGGGGGGGGNSPPANPIAVQALQLAGLGASGGGSGDDGQDGAPGAQGIPGVAGAAGSAGVAGAMGWPGFDGIDGQDGQDGPPGVPGAAGAAGSTGSTGSTGAVGPAGLTIPGWDGDDGGDQAFSRPPNLLPALSDQWLFSNPTASSSTTTGALTVAGGAGIGGALYIGEILFVGGALSGVGSSQRADIGGVVNGWGAGQYMATGATNPLQTMAVGFATTENVGFIQPYISGTGYNDLWLCPAGGIVHLATTTASTSTTTGALTIGGGIGAGGSLYLGLGGGTTNPVIFAPVSSNTTYGCVTFNGVTTLSGMMGLAGGALGDLGMYIVGAQVHFYAGTTGVADFTTTGAVFHPTTASTSTTTGALTVAGGVGVAGALVVGTYMWHPTVADAAVACVMTAAAGPTGAHTAIQEWFTFKNAAGTIRYIPCW